MNIIRENKIVLEFNGQTELSILKKMVELATPKENSISNLFSSSKPKFTTKENDFIIQLSNALENISE